MQLHRSPHSRGPGHAPGPQWAYPADRRIEPEGLQLVSPCRGTGPLPRRQQIPGDLTRRTGTRSLLQVNTEVILREVFPVRTARHTRDQAASGVDKGLPGITVAISGISQRLLHRHTGIGLALLHQFQGPQVVRSVAGQYFHSSNELGIGVHHNCRLMPVEALGCCSCGRGASPGHAPTPSDPCSPRP